MSALNEIGKIVKYYGDKSFRYKTDLINELGQYVQCKLYEHVCCGIIEDLLEGLVKREGKMLSVVSVEKGAFSTLEL